MKTIPQRVDLPFVPALEGLRAVAAMGVMVTHVAFQTGGTVAILERLDFMVAVFFALSAFLLWRRRGRHSAREYYLHRFRRVMPAYWACAAAVLLLLPGAGFTAAQVVANLTATQIFVPNGLAQGLTHLWSLCVEFSFYLALPLLARVKKHRVAWIAAAGVASLGWAWVAQLVDVAGVNAQIWPPAFTLWFAVGMLAAEYEGRVRAPRLVWPFWLLALACLWLASREWFGPRGLVHPQPAEFVGRVVLGAVFAACLVVPYALGARSLVLESRLMRLLGLWSYGIFLWHVAVLWVVFPVTGIPFFSGHFFPVLVATAAGTIPVAAASYYFVEVPAQQRLRQLRKRPR
ncbi:hypothetical protein CPHO_11340 [Corynebacterium phocae]|uniref:Acyltransferase 3 domain-containing protein n=1 Tax=Corynebacterium phocae TaxID=161895 RepID=A0A1L7D5G0_9CORY|nr:acyltransferase [Corynebacterium phocae]APT93379.1 hypothetical protein CPHO_11340 [Corynebacterium phocae]KAA8721721.1 acyltransferase [Corynebacterium phocae]